MRFPTFPRRLPRPLRFKAASIVALVPTAVLLLLVTLGSQSYAQTYAYSINNGAWSDTATWNTNPVNGLQAVVSGGNTVSFGAGDSYTGSDAWWSGLGVGSGPEYGVPGAGTLNITGGTLTSGAMWAGHGGTGTINLSGGTLNIGGQHMLFGWNYTSDLNVSGGTLNMAGSGNIFRFGHTAQSFMNITSNGVANLSGGGIDLMSNSQINVNGGTLNLTNTTQANSIVNLTAGSQMVVQGGGTLNMQAGTQTINATEGFWLGFGGTTGTLNLSGGTWQQNPYMRLGVFANGNGIINQTGGTFEMANDFEAWGSSPSAYNLQGGTFRVMTNGVQINSYSGGSMTFNITGSSGNVTMDTLAYDFTAPNTSVFNNAAATLTKTGAGSLTVSGRLDIRNGALSMESGTIDTLTGTFIGTEGGTASGTMSGGTLKTGYQGGANFSVGRNAGTGTFTQSGGNLDVGNLANVVIGWNSGSSGTYTLNGGSYSAVTNNTFIGYAGGSGTVNVNGGTFAAYNLLVGGNDAASGTLNLNGGTLSLASPDGFYVDSNGTLNLNSGGSLPSSNLRLGSGGKLNFNGGTGNAALNILAGGGAGGTVDVRGQTLATGSWENLVAFGAGVVLKNSSPNGATIAGGNTIWIWDAATNLTVDASGGDIQIDSWITSSGQATPTGIIKTGTNNLILTYAGNGYTGTTAINEGRIVLTDGNALGSTSGGTIVASGAQLLLTNVAVVAEPLTISGNGLASGSATAGALRSIGTNSYAGKITLGADAKIFGGSGTSLTLEVASGDAIDLAGFDLVIDGAGTVQVNDPIVGTNQISKTGSGALVISNSTLTATIRSSSVDVAFASVPTVGSYAVLPGPVGTNSLASKFVTGLGSGLTATLTNDPNLVVKVASTAPAGPTFDSAYPSGTTMTDVAPNGLTYLVNYAFGGSSTTSATLPSQDTSDPTKLTLVAYVRTNNAVGTLSVVGEKGNSLSNFDTSIPITGEVALDQVNAPAGTQKRIFSVPATGDRLFLRLKVTLTP
jgi:autotransporter-associated beta strand protein